MAVNVRSPRPSDDFTHPVDEESNFNESMYFNFFDRERRIGGFLRVGNRPNEGYAEVTATCFLPTGRVLFDFQRPKIAGNDRLSAGGMTFEVIEAGKRLRTTYRGNPLALDRPNEMADPRKAFASNPRVALNVDVTHTAIGPMYGSTGDEAENKAAAEQQFAKAHYEQHMSVDGSVEIDGLRLGIHGHGLRDHSWGPRYWQAIEGYEWLTMNFGDDLGAMVSVIRRPDAPARVGGVVVEGTRLDPIMSTTIDIDYEPGTSQHRNLNVDATTRGGRRLAIEGKVLSFIPLRNRRKGRTTHLGEGLTEWKLGNRIGYGLSELLRTI